VSKNFKSKLLIDLLNHKKKHLWLIKMNGYLDNGGNELALTKEDIEKGNRFRFPKDRMKYLFYHSRLRMILSEYCQKDPKEIEFTYGKLNKPSLKDNRFNLQFNFSYSDNIAVCGVISNQSFGVDVEAAKRQIDIDSVSNNFFSEKEKNLLAKLKGEEKRLAFYSLWTGKEAYGKAIGLGITYPLHQVTIPIFSETRFLGLDGREWELERFILIIDKEPYIISCVAEISGSQSRLLMLNSKNFSINYEFN